MMMMVTEQKPLNIATMISDIQAVETLIAANIDNYVCASEHFV